jgi:hypothetical protein
MQVTIENYRGFEISFDTEKETFLSYSTEWDRDMAKKSYAASKKWVDDFIKENSTFKSVLAAPVIGSYTNKTKITLTGMRKDNRFMAEDAKGQFQISEHDEDKYAVYDPSHDAIKDRYDAYTKQISDLRDEQKRYLKENYKPVTLTQYKKQLLGQ